MILGTHKEFRKTSHDIDGGWTVTPDPLGHAFSHMMLELQGGLFWARLALHCWGLAALIKGPSENHRHFYGLRTLTAEHQ